MKFKFNNKLKEKIPVVIDFFEKALYSNKLFHAYLLSGKNQKIKEFFNSLYFVNVLILKHFLVSKTLFIISILSVSNYFA